MCYSESPILFIFAQDIDSDVGDDDDAGDEVDVHGGNDGPHDDDGDEYGGDDDDAPPLINSRPICHVLPQTNRQKGALRNENLHDKSGSFRGATLDRCPPPTTNVADAVDGGCC